MSKFGATTVPIREVALGGDALPQVLGIGHGQHISAEGPLYPDPRDEVSAREGTDKEAIE